MKAPYGREAVAHDRTIPELIEEHFHARPHAEAVCSSDGESMSYRALDAASQVLADHLTHELDIGPEVIVPLCFEKSIWTVVAIVAVLRAGAAFVLLDPAHPTERLDTIIRKCKARVAITSPASQKRLAQLLPRALCLDKRALRQLEDAAASPSSSTPSSPCSSTSSSSRHHAPPPPQPHNAAYIVYTSGSTGTPKGALIEHGSFVAGALGHAAAMHMTSSTRAVQFASYNFDASITEMLTTLVVGGTVCVVCEDARLDPIAFADAVKTMRADWAILTSSFIGALELVGGGLEGLKTLVQGGEAMSAGVLERWVEKGVVLMNAYGQVEASVVATCTPPISPQSNGKSIGLAVAGRCWVVDPENPNVRTAPGEVGELLVEGPHVGRGYLDEPEKTAAVFIGRPTWHTRLFPTETDPRALRFYRTGDLVEQQPDGSFTYVSRKDDMVKLNGQRVECGEIEVQFRRAMHPPRDIIVELVKRKVGNGPGRGVLVGFVALDGDWSDGDDDDHQVNQQRLDAEMQVAEKQVRDVLPKFMMPSAFIAVPRIPISMNGKVDRKGLRALGEAKLSRKQSPVALPSAESKLSRAENELRRVWSRVLNVPEEEINRTSAFQSLGGDSISAMQVVSQAASCGLPITVQRILQKKTIAEITSGMVDEPIPKTESLPSTDDEGDEGEPFKLSPIQQLFFHLSPKGDNQDNISFLLRLNRNVTRNAVDNALEAVVSHNPMLRARFFEMKRGCWFQYISDEVLESYQLCSHIVNGTSESELMPIIKDTQRDLDIKYGPLIRADLMTTRGGKEQLLFVCAHHLVTDFVSWRIILQQLEEYITRGGTITSSNGCSFQKWCKLQERYIRSLPPQKLPFELPEPDYGFWGMEKLPNSYGDAVTEVLVLDERLSSMILGAASQSSLEVEAVDVLLASTMSAFHAVFPERPVPAFFVEGHGREPSWDETIDLSSTVGWFTTILPMVVSQKTCKSPADTIREIKALRAQFPDKGLAHFASHYYKSRQQKHHHGANSPHYPPMEITFNYAGKYQQLERAESLFTEVPNQTLMHLDGFGTALPRFGLVEILGNVVDGGRRLKLSFTMNARMRHRERIGQWMRECERVLAAVAPQLGALPTTQQQQQQEDRFPLLRAQPAETARLMREVLPNMGVEAGEVEDAYPCSPMQNGMLLSRAGDRGSYTSQLFLEVQSSNGNIDLPRLERAWQAVIDRHAALRTVFVESVRGDGSFDQVVLRQAKAAVAHVDDVEVHPVEPWAPNQPEHRLLVAKSGNASNKLQLRLDISHVCIDGSSTSILTRDLQHAYAPGNLSSSALPSRLSYRSYIEHITSSSSSHAQSLQYWTDHLAGAQPCHLPSWSDSSTTTDPPTLSFAPVTPPINAAATTSFCRLHGLTLSDLLKTAWAIVLRAYNTSSSSSASDPVFGYLSSGRGAVDAAEDALGVFTNIQACRARLPPTATVLECLRGVQDDGIEQMPHRECPLADVVHAMGGGEGGGGEGLFGTAMSLQRVVGGAERGKRGDGVEVRVVREMDPTEYAATFLGYVSETGIELVIEYWTSKISKLQAENLAATVSKVVESIVQNPYSAVGDLEVISDRDLTSMKEWNSKLASSAPVNSCIHHLIQQFSKQQPDRPAIHGWDGKLSYSELDQLSSQLAGHLHNLGVGPECIVPVCMEKSTWTIVAMLSILKAGGAFVPFDPEAPLDRLLGLLKDTSANIVVASPKTAARLQEHVQQVVVSPSFIKNLPVRKFRGTVTPDNLAYVLFTSGTTGVPKGIMMQHSQFLASSTRYSPLINLSPSSRVLQFSAYTFDASIFELWSTLTTGGCVCQISDAQRMNDVARAINALRPDTMFMTPTMLDILAPASGIPSIRTVITGGEVIKQGIFRAWAGAPQGVEHLVEAYGPTETAVYATFQTAVQPSSDRFSIGRSFCCRAWVVDPETAASSRPRLVPVGAAGELWLEGPSLARGYLNADAKTAAAFVERPDFLATPTPSASVPELRRFYRTGDLVRFKANGELQFVGRNDSQVKVRGQRVELSEIEQQAAMVLPTVMPLAVEVVDSKLVLMVEIVDATDEHVAETVAMLEAKLPSRLPRYMVPSTIVAVTDEPFPRMSSGKLDRKKLRAMAAELGSRQRAAARMVAAGEMRAPESLVETKLKAMLASVLPSFSSEEVRMDDNFFHLGGDSFLAMKLVAAARVEGMRLSVASVLRNPILRDLAKTMQAETPNELDEAPISNPFELIGGPAALIRAEAVAACELKSEDEIEDIYPTTPLQEAFVVESAKNPTAYMAYHAVKLPSNFDFDKFRAAWEVCVQENTILRTVIFQTVQTKPPRPMQVVLRRKAVEWEQSHDLKAFLNQSRHASTISASRVAIISDRASRTRSFVWLAHHTLYDGFSVSLLLQRLRTLYHNSGPNTPSPTPVPFRKYIDYLTTVQSSPATTAFWTSYLSNATATPFPPTATTSSSPDTSANFTIRLPPPPSSSSPTTPVTLATTLRTAWALLLASYTNHPADILFAAIVSGRQAPLPGIADALAGPTIAAVPVRIACAAADEKLSAVLLRVQDDAAAMAPHEALGLRGVQGVLGRKGDVKARKALAGVRSLFVVQPPKTADNAADEWGVESKAVEVGSSYSYPVTVVCEPQADGVAVEVVYASEAMGRAEVEGMVGRFEEVVRRLLVDDGEGVVGDVLEAVGRGSRPAAAAAAVAGELGAVDEDALTRSGSETRSEMERRLQEMWAESLGLDDPQEVGVQDDFLRLGGDSLTAMQLSGVARREGFSLRVVDIMKMPVLREMAQCMTALGGADKKNDTDAAPFSLMPDASSEHVRYAAADCKVTVGDVEDMYPCTPLQEGLMTASGKQAGSYVAQIVLDLKHGTDMEWFKAAWESVVATHQILRTRIVHLGEAGMFQAVLKASKPAINWRTASSVDAYVKRDQTIPMGFGDELSRYGLITSNGKSTFIWTAHHAIYDGATVTMLSDAISAAYHHSNKSPSAPPPFSRFIKYLNTLSPAASDTFWRTTLAGAATTPFPLPLILDYTPRASRTVTRAISLPTKSTNSCNSNITTATLLQTAWALVLSRYASSADVTLGIAQSGRLTPVADVASLPGPTLTTAPLRINLSDDRETVSALLHRVQEQSAAAIPHCHHGLQAIRRLGDDEAAACEFRTLLTLNPEKRRKKRKTGGEEEEEEEEEELVCDLVHGGRVLDTGAFHTYPLLLECVFDNDDGKANVRACATHDDRVLGEPLVERMVAQFEHVLRQLVRAADDGGLNGLAVADVELLTAEDLESLRQRDAWVVDVRNRDALVPMGVVGELVVEKAEAGLTAVQPAWLEKLGFARSKRVYATGKLARFGEDGEVEVIGDMQELVELQDGRRFVARDVEKMVSQVMWDRQIAIQVTDEGSLTAFVALEHGYVDDEIAQKLLDALVTSAGDRLSRALPSFMLPKAFLPVRSLPRTVDGNIDRLRLREMVAPKTTTSEVRETSEEAMTRGPSEMEQRLLSLWKSVLGLDNIAVSDSFLRLGGDSLDAMKLVAAARRQDIVLTVKDIFDNPVLTDMAQLATKPEPTAAFSDAIEPFSMMNGNTNALVEEVAAACQIDADAIEDIYPCAPLQEGLMALSNVERGAYVAECVIPIPDAERAVAAWKALVAITPVLRTRITQMDQWGSVQAVVKEEAEIATGNNLDDYLREAREIPTSSGNRLVRAGVVVQGTSQHLVLFTHHSVFDGWSWKLILQQLYSLYQEQAVPQSPPYNKFIQYLHQGLHPQQAEEFWRSYLEGAERTAFPPVSSSIVPQPDSHETRRIILGRSGENTSSSMIQTAWALLVSRYADSKDVVIGVTLSGRTAPVDGIQDMIGPTFATIPLRFTLDGTKTVNELAKNAQDVSIDPVQHLGLQRIRQVSASAHAACTFNSLLVVQPASAEDDDSSGNFFMSENDAQLVSSFTNYGFVLLCQMLPDGNIDASLVFDSRLTSNRQAYRLLGQFEHVLQQINDGAARTVHDIDYLSPEDMKEVSEFNRELDPVPHADLCMHDLVKHHARIRPNAPAVSSWDGDLTYAELDVLATQLAGHLATSMGIGPGNTVPLCFEKSKWTQVAMLGVLKAGAAFLLLDPAHPLARLESICRKVHANTVIVSTGLDALLTHTIRNCLVLDEMTTLLTDPWLPVAVTPSDAAYVVTTSGTSGAAKACVISHGSIVAGALAFAARAHVNASTRAMQFASYSFDASIIETLMVWAAGGCTCVLSETQRKDEPAAAIAARRANWALMTPSLAGILSPATVPTMETVVLGGEAATAELLGIWGKSVTLLQAYGPCECTPVACCSLAPMGVASNPRNIGRPLSGVRAWIVDPDTHDKLAPVGAVGELVLEGPTVGRGYVDDADKTAAAFIAAPKWRQKFAGQIERFYNTGDLVRYAEDGGSGTLEFVGRKDAQIKVRGQRIELAEIEQNLRRCMATASKCDVAVELVTPEGGNAAAAYLAAFVAFGDAYDQEMEGQDKLAATFADAKAKLGEVLPSYMVPRVFFPLRQLPLSAAGKVDRKALRQMAAAMNQNRELDTPAITGSAPTTGMEQILQSLWARVLDVQVDAVHTDANFIELGGDSLSAMKLAAKARQAGLSLSVADIMRRPRFAEMAAKCEPSAEMEPTSEYKPFSASPEGADVDAFLRETLAVDRNEVEDVIEATSVQKAMTEAAMSPHQGTVNYVWLHFAGPIDKQRVKDACSRVVAHHGILRTVFVPFKQQLMQVVFRSHEPEWEEHTTKDTNIEDATASIISASRQRPEQYGKHGLRFSFLTDRQLNASRLIIRIPHSLYDGITLPLILDDLRTAYEQRDLPSVPSFPAHLHAWRHRQSTSGAEAFWRTELKGSRMTPIVIDARRDSHTAVDDTAAAGQPTTTTAAAAVNGHITQHIALAQQSTKTKHTFETLFHTAWALVLRSVSNNTNDVVFARAIANRALPLPSAASVCGPTLNTVPVRVNLAKYVNTAATGEDVVASSADDADALLSAVEDARLAALPYECLETERLVRRCTDWCGEGSVIPRFGSLLLWNNIAAAKTFDEGCLPGWGGSGSGSGGEEAATTTTKCELGWAVAPWDAADVQVTATPVVQAAVGSSSSGGNVGGIRIDVLFAEERVPRDLAGRMVEMLCRNVEELWRGGEGVVKGLLLGEEGVVQDGGVLLGQEQEKGGGGGYDSSSLGDMSPDHAPTPESYEIVSSEGWGEI